LIDIVSIIVFLTTFVIPLYTISEPDPTYSAIIIRVLFSGDTNYDVIIYFIVNFLIFLSIFLYFAKCISNYFFDKEKFINKSKTLVTATFIATLSFFIMGLVMSIYYTLAGDTVLMMCLVDFHLLHF